MQTIISTIAISNFELIFLVIIPAILIIAGVIYIVTSNLQFKKLDKIIDEFIKKLNLLTGCTIKHTAELELYANESESELLKDNLNNLIIGSKEKYEGKWLPELNSELNLNTLAEPQLKSSFQYTPTILIFSCGLMATIILAIVPIINPASFSINNLLSIIPLIVAILVSLFLLNHRNIIRQKTETTIDNLCREIERYLPIYSDKAGLALLVNEMTAHENSIDESLSEFNTHLESFVSNDFQDNISLVIKEIMEEDIAPPINQSSQLLSELAEELSNKQNTGMADLAQRFSEELTISVSKNFKTVEKELESFNYLMDDTKNFIQDSIAILENSRQQNILLNREVSESIELMTLAKNDIANEMATMSDYLEVISSVTERMTSVYAGEDANLKEQIGSLESALNNSLETINSSIVQSKATLDLSSQLKNDQADQSKNFIDKMDKLLQELNLIGTSIKDSTQNFKEKSNTNVETTLSQFEQALANVVERLIYTTAEIRDAVEDLPLALRSDTEKE